MIGACGNQYWLGAIRLYEKKIVGSSPAYVALSTRSTNGVLATLFNIKIAMILCTFASNSALITACRVDDKDKSIERHE